MLPRFQPSRPKPPQQSAPPTYAPQQQRAAYAAAHVPRTSQNPAPTSPRSQLEAMPPFGPPHTPATFVTPVYDSAVRHPVFFTQNLKKPPFPIPQAASRGWNPVANGYIVEQRKDEVSGKTKL